MALTLEIGREMPDKRILMQAYKTHSDGVLLALISGATGLRIKIWRMFVTCAASGKNCQVLSGTDPFTTLYGQQHQLRSSEGIPVFTCNAGEDFKADPDDGTAWFYHIVYSMEP